jgi:16S rRNA (guanine527-N7)-methyltransferase
MHHPLLNDVVGQAVPLERYQKIERYAALIQHWQKAINLVSPSTLPTLWERHVLDSAQLYPYIPASTSSIMDVGAGAGLPGVVLGLLNPEWKMTLVESDHRKAEFLKNVSRETFSDFRVVCDRIEKLEPQNVHVITSRACASSSLLLSLVEAQLVSSPQLLLLKGKLYEEEIFEARKQWEFDLDVFASKCDPNGVVLSLQRVRKK